ncbi:MAG: outer membrane beta-barrel protein [Gemmatimonadetes bacterium]|nr:outer membrane beta-barrel protein [Gemmatimonadota bacterium]
MFTGRSAPLCLLLCSLAGPAAAQEVPITLEERNPVTLTGFAVGVASYDRNLRENTAAGSKLALSLFRPWSDRLYLFGQLTTHLERDDSTGEPVTEMEIDNLIVSWTPRGASALSLAVGRFDAPLGFERDDEPLNLIPTGSFNFEFARPAKLTGAVVRYALSPQVTLTGMVANGWNQELDNNSGKTGGLGIQVFPAERLAVRVTALYGPETAGTNGAQRTLVTADATFQPVSRFILGVEANRSAERSGGTSLRWTGAAATAFWRFDRSIGVTVRGEVLDDGDGAATATAQTLRSLTISPWYFYREAREGVFTNVEHTTFRLPAFALRPAIRFDRSDQPFFEDRNGNLVRANMTAVLELVYLF